MSFKLITITHPYKSSTTEIESICQLFEAGLKILHLRKLDVTKKELREYLQNIPTQFHKRIVIHSNYSLLREFDLKGIHLTEKSRKRPLSKYYH